MPYTIAPIEAKGESLRYPSSKRAAELGIENFRRPRPSPHLREACAAAAAAIEQIKFLLLGHSSIQTSERDLGSTRELERAVNDDWWIE
jgi:hypothetical protein